VVFHNSVPCSSATRLVQVHWLEFIIRLHLHHRGPLLSDSGNVMQYGTCNNYVTAGQVQPSDPSDTEIFPLVAQRSFECVPLSRLELHCNGFVGLGFGSGNGVMKYCLQA